jgi:mono/diheme cytochrome c family protein
MRSAPRGATRSLPLILVASVLVVAMACGQGGEVTEPERSAVERGRTLYQANCATCHGVAGEGQPNWQSRREDGSLPAPPHDATGHTWHHSDDQLLDIIRRGGQVVYGGPGFQSGMPAWDDRLTEEEIEAVLEYIKTLWGDEERAYQAELSSE